MKIQQKRVSTTPSVSGNQTIPQINSQQGSRGEEKNNFQMAVALLAAQKQKKAGNIQSHKNSMPENICQEQNNSFNNSHLVFQQIQNNNINQQNGNQATQKLNQSFNKGLQNQQHQQQFHLPVANNQNQQYQMNQQSNQGWNFSNSLNKSNILDSSYGNYMNQPPNYSMSTQNQQHQLQLGNQFSGQKYSLKTSYIGQGAQQSSGLNNSNASGAGQNTQQTRPSLAQQKLNQLLDQTKGGRQSPNQISATEQSVLTMNSSFNGNQKNYFNNSFQGQQQFNQAYNQIQNPSFTLPATNQTVKNSNAFNNTINNHTNNVGQVSHTLQDASPLRKTRQSLEIRTRPLLTEGNVTSGQGVNQNNSITAPQYNSLITQQDQSINNSNNKSNGLYIQHGSSSSSNPAPQPHYMLQKPNQKPYAARIYKQNKTSILNKNDTLNNSKDRSFGQQNQILQTSLIESNRNNNNYLIGSGGKPKQNQQYLHLNYFNSNTQPAQINRNMTISPVAAATSQINKTDNYNKTNPALYNNNNTLQSNYHPLNTFLNSTTTSNNMQSGSAAQAFIQQVKDKINQNKKGKSPNSMGGNGSQNNSQILQSQYQQGSFIHQGNLSTTGAEINTSGIQNQTCQSQNQNTIKSPQANFLNNNNIFQSNAAPPHPQPQYHHQKNSKSMTISKNTFMANINIQSPIGNTTQVNLNSSKESGDYSFLNQNFNVLQAQVSQSPSIHSIQKKPKLQISNLNSSNNGGNQQQNSINPQQFLQQPRAQTQASSRREQETQKSNASNPQRNNQQHQNQHGSASQLIDDQTNLSNITTNFITINENNKSSPKIYAKTYQDSFRFYDELLEDFIQKNKFSNEKKLDYFDNFLITLNEIQRRTQVNQKLNFSQQQQQLNQQNHQMQQNLLQISSSHNTAASLFQNSTQSSATFRFFENLKQILESPIQNLLQESRQQRLEFEQKKSQVVRELDLERKERAVLEMKIDILEQEKEKLQNLVTTLSKQQINNQKSRNQSTNSHTNSHNTSHNNTSGFNNTNFSNPNIGGGFNLNQQEIQMLLSENEKLKNVAKKQRKQMNANRQKEEKLMKLLYAIRKLGINVDEIYNDNVKTPESLSPNGENQNRLQQKVNDFISPEHNQLSQFQPWELSQDHNISQNTTKVNKNQGIQNQEYQGSNQKGSQPSSKRQAVNSLGQKQKKYKKENEKPFYVNSQNEEDDDEENDNQEIEEEDDDEYENNLSDSRDNSQGFVQDEDYDSDNNNIYDNKDNYGHNISYKNQQYKMNGPDQQWNEDGGSGDQQNLLASPKQVNAEMQYKMRFQKLATKQNTEGSQMSKNNNEYKGRYSNQNNNNNHSFDDNESRNQQNQNIQFIINKDQNQNFQQNNNNKFQDNQKNQMSFNNNKQNNNQQNQFQIQQQNFIKNNNFNQDNEHDQSNRSPQQNYMEKFVQNSDQKNNQYYQHHEQQHHDLDPLYSEKSVTDSESDVLSIPVNEVAYASQSNKMINAQMKDKLKINLGCLQVKDPANNNMNLNLGKLNGEGQQGQVVHEEIFGYHDEFMNKFDEFSQSWRDAINKEKQRYQNNMAPISHIYVSAL